MWKDQFGYNEMTNKCKEVCKDSCIIVNTDMPREMDIRNDNIDVKIKQIKEFRILQKIVLLNVGNNDDFNKVKVYQ